MSIWSKKYLFWLTVKGVSLLWLERGRSSSWPWKQENKTSCALLHGARSRNDTERNKATDFKACSPEIYFLQLAQPRKASTGSPTVPSGDEPVSDTWMAIPPCSASLCGLGHFVSSDKFLEMELLIWKVWTFRCVFIFTNQIRDLLSHTLQYFLSNLLSFVFFIYNMLKWLSYTRQTQMDTPVSLSQNN